MSYSQETPLDVDLDVNIIEEFADIPKVEETIVRLPELGELKIKFLEGDIEEENLFRLASFYLSYQLYHQAAEFYGLYTDKVAQDPKLIQRKATAHYNRALSLFSLQIYKPALKEFNLAYYHGKIADALRMAGTVTFLQKNKEKSLEYWNKYLSENATPSPERSAIENAVGLLMSPDFEFEKEEVSESTPSYNTNNSSWPFLDPEIIPNPEATYDKKRVI